MSEKINKRIKDPVDEYVKQSFYQTTLTVLLISIWSVVGFHIFISSFPTEVVINELQLPLIIGFVFAWNMITWLALLGWTTVLISVFGLRKKKDKNLTLK